MPTLRPDTPLIPVVAILCSDIHLQIKPPAARMEEPDWFEAMRRTLAQVSELQAKHDVPVICAGDVFDRWNSPAELINFALAELPDQMFAIPGQHDMPLHRTDLLHRSAFETLTLADKITELKPKRGVDIGYDILVYGFPWGTPLTPPCSSGFLHVAVIHEYVWTATTGYQGAPDECNIDRRKRDFEGWDIVVVGDNHKGFSWISTTHDEETLTVYNCGTLMRRRSDEEHYQPRVGILYADGRIIPHKLDISQDVHIPTMGTDIACEDPEIQDFIDELQHLENCSLDFREALMQTMRRIPKAKELVKRMIMEALDGRP